MMADTLRFSPSKQEVSSTSSSESGLSPVLFTTSLKQMPYTNEGQLTPPSSPDKEPEPMNTEPSFSSLSGRFRLTRFLTRSSRSPRLSKKASRKITQTEFGYGKISNPVFADTSDLHPNNPYISAEPCTPQSEDTGDQGAQIPVLVPALRRISSSHADLRGMAKLQSKLGFCDMQIPSYPASPLLPSPIIDKRKESIDSVQKQGYQRSYKSYDDLHILSYYQDANAGHRDIDGITGDIETTGSGSEVSTIDSNGQEFHAAESYTADCEGSPGSSESGWLANTMSYEQRTQRFTARCCQVVQQPRNDDQGLQDTESKIMMATVLVGLGKPKLVQIQRPPSSNGSPREWLDSHAAKNVSTASVLPDSPVTPAREPQEISAFSPFDTPADDDDDTDNPDDSIRERPATSPEASLIKRSHSLFQVWASSNSESFDKFELPQPNQRNSRTTTRLRDVASPAPLCRSDDETDVRDETQKALCSFYPFLNAEELNTKLDMVICMIDRFPQRLPSLDDPLIITLRSTDYHLRDPELLRGLAKVFPLAPRKLLSAIAAWQIVADHFSKLEPEKIDKELLTLHEVQPTQSLSKRTPSITRLRRTLRKKPFNSIHQLSQLPSQHFRLPNWNSSPPLAASVAPSGRGRLQRSMSLHSDIIPAKARNVLGIESVVSNACTNPTSKDTTLGGRLLSSKIIVVQKRIEVIARKLLQLVRDHYIVEGQREWDAKLWSAIGLVIALVEGFDKTGLQNEQRDGMFDLDRDHFSQYEE